MKKRVVICLLWPCWLWAQESQSNLGDIPWQLLGYRNDTVKGLGSGLRSSALPASSRSNISIMASSKHNIQGSGMIGITISGSNGVSGKKMMLGSATSPVHSSLIGELGYGLMLSKSLSVGISLGATYTKIIDTKMKLLPHAEVGFLNQLNKNVSWGAHYRQYGQEKTITTGLAYQFNEEIQLVAEIEKGSNQWFGFTVLLSTMIDKHWLTISGYKAHSSLSYCYIGYVQKKQILGAGISFHPQLGSSLQLHFSKLFH